MLMVSVDINILSVLLLRGEIYVMSSSGFKFITSGMHQSVSQSVHIFWAI
jgi:hypothetical protein